LTNITTSISILCVAAFLGDVSWNLFYYF
jgi:hypothetical protein